MSFAAIAYALACIVVPMAWGLVVVWASNAIEARVAKSDAEHHKPKKHVSRVEYHI